MRIVPCPPHQTRAVVELWRASFAHGVGLEDPHPFDEHHRYFVEQVLPHHTVRVALDAESPVGFMASTPESIAQLYVGVSHIGRGIGSALVRLAQAEAAGQLWLHTFAHNHRARRFYEHHGFIEVERESANMWNMEAIKYLWQRAEATP